jgi:disulfide bond formation protein DsbB
MKTFLDRFHRPSRDMPATVFYLSLAALGLGLVAVILANTLRLEACHLCIFQRLACFLTGVSLFIAFATWDHFWLSFIGLLGACVCSAWGAYVAAQQSWLQWFPASSFTCTTIEPSFTERLVDRLGELAPTLFMATGSCESEDLVIFGLTLANWSFVFFSGFLVAGIGTLFHERHSAKTSRQPGASLRETS